MRRMNRLRPTARLALLLPIGGALLCVLPGVARAQASAAPASPAASAAAARASAAPATRPAPAGGMLVIEEIRGEPRVQQTVIEDEGSRIEEMRVRGNTTRISVQPKVGTSRGYEIITEDGSRDVSDGLTGSRGAAGKRVWRVLSF